MISVCSDAPWDLAKADEEPEWSMTGAVKQQVSARRKKDNAAVQRTANALTDMSDSLLEYAILPKHRYSSTPSRVKLKTNRLSQNLRLG
jgi:hypothetical protein